MDFTTSYAAIIKQEKQDDGTMLVYGKATDDSIDSDNQICDAGWLEKAMPEWFKTGGNIREQHSNIAAGVAKELDSKADGHYISALVVDPTSVKKVEAGVLKGFSIGIRAPRVVRDNKAANGRIIDGQIVEVSLVDRPANPNAKLMLAKSDGGEVVQVEEMIEQEKTSVAATIKALAGDLSKYDEAAYNQAVSAIATLISTEAQEMATEGSDERDDIETLLDALKHLFRFYKGEVIEGEVAGVMPTDAIADAVNDALGLAAEPETVKGDDCDCEGCASCAAQGGCDNSPCSKCMGAKSAEAETTDKCLECGCHVPADSHGRTDVTTAEMVTPDSAPKSSEPSSDVSLPNFDLEAVVEKAVKSAKESVLEEIALLKSEKESVEQKVISLETELAAAEAKAVSGGPKRTGKAMRSNSELETLANQYRAKAAVTTDPILAKGYAELAEDFAIKAAKGE